MDWIGNQNLNNYQDKRLVVHKGISFPLSPVVGQLYYRTDLIILYQYTPDGWVPITGGFSGINLRTGVDLVYTDATTVTVKAGTLAIGVTLLENAADTVVDVTDVANWLETPPTDYTSTYVYCVQNGTSFDVKLSSSNPVYSSVDYATDNNLIYRKFSSIWHRCIGTFIPSSDILLLHMDGESGSNYFKDSSFYNRKITAVGSARIDDSQAKFGQSGLFGSGNYLSLPDSREWQFENDFTIDFWVRFNTLPTTGNRSSFFMHYQDASHYLSFSLLNTTGTYTWNFNQVGGSALTMQRTSPGLSINTWYHIAVVRTGNIFKIFQNGTQVGIDLTYTHNLADFIGYTTIGYYTALNPYPVDGWIDEYRITRGAEWTTTFIPPTSAYSLLVNNDIFPFVIGSSEQQKLNVFRDDYVDLVPVNASDIFLLLHCDGAGGSTAFTDSSQYARSVVSINNAQIYAADKVFGTGSALFSANVSPSLSSNLQVAASYDWDFDSDFTIDFRVKFTTLGALSGNYVSLISHGQQSGGATDYYQIMYNINNWSSDGTLHAAQTWEFLSYLGGSVQLSFQATDAGVTTGVWYHFALVRYNKNWYIFRDGVLKGSVLSAINITKYGGVLGIGILNTGTGGSTNPLDGLMDEIRIQKGAAWTSNFSVPIAAYSDPAANTWQELNMSFLPTTARMAMLRVRADNAAITGGVILRPKGGNLSEVNYVGNAFKGYALNKGDGISIGPVYIGENRKIEYYANTTLIARVINCLGYFEEC